MKKFFALCLILLWICGTAYATVWDNVDAIEDASGSATTEYSADYLAFYAMDGSNTTRWAASAGVPQSFTVDLGAGGAKALVKFGIQKFNGDSGAAIKAFTINGSADNSSYTELASVEATNTADKTWQYFTFANTTAYRYYKITITSTWAGDPTFYEIVAYEKIPSYYGDMIPDMTGNSAPSGTASADSQYSDDYAAWLAMNDAADGNPWASEFTDYPHWLKYQFPNTTNVVGYTITGHSSAPETWSPTAWTLEGSTDNSDWTTLDTRSSVTWTAGYTFGYKLASEANYTYYRFTTTAGGQGSQIAEIELIGVPTTTAPALTTTSYVPTGSSISLTANISNVGTGASSITRRGVCYIAGIDGTPTTADSVNYTDGPYSTGSFTINTTNLTGSGCYRMRPYAVNDNAETGYSINTETICTYPVVLFAAFGDSKTYDARWRDKLSIDSDNPSYRMVDGGLWALSGGTCAQIVALLDDWLAATTETPTAVLYNCGANDMATMSDEATFKAANQSGFDKIHAKFADTKIYVTFPWRGAEDADAATLKTWFQDLITLNSTFVNAADDEAVWMKGVDDGATNGGLHYTDAGIAEKVLQIQALSLPSYSGSASTAKQTIMMIW